MVAVKMWKTRSIVGERRHGNARHPTRFEEWKRKSRIDEKSRDYRNNRSLSREHNECCFMNDAWPFFSHHVLPALLQESCYSRIPSKDTVPLLIWAMDLILDKLERILFFRRSKSSQTGRREIHIRLYHRITVKQAAIECEWMIYRILSEENRELITGRRRSID